MSQGAQRPPTSLAVGVEIADAATRLAAVVDPLPNARRWHARLLTPPTPEKAIAHIAVLIQRAAVESQTPNGDLSASAESTAPSVTSVGVAVAGDIDATTGTVRVLVPSPSWAGFPLADELARALGPGSTVRLSSTTEAAALAEARQGAGAGYASVFYLALGRTVSSALVVQGQVIHGDHSAAGRLGHVQVRVDGPRCRCGARGHLEPIASAQSIVRAMIGRASGSDESMAAMLHITGGRAEAMSAAQVVQLAHDGDPAAGAVLAAVLDALATVLADVVALIDPGVIVVDGPLVEAGEAFFGPLRQEVQARCASFATPFVLSPSRLYPWTALLGARLIAPPASHQWG